MIKVVKWFLYKNRLHRKKWYDMFNKIFHKHNRHLYIHHYHQRKTFVRGELLKFAFISTLHSLCVFILAGIFMWWLDKRNFAPQNIYVLFSWSTAYQSKKNCHVASLCIPYCLLAWLDMNRFAFSLVDLVTMLAVKWNSEKEVFNKKRNLCLCQQYA